MHRLFTPLRLLIGGIVLLAVAGYLFVWPSGDYIFLPEDARPLAPLVKIEGEQRPKDSGGIYFVAVDVRKATTLERLFPRISEGATVVPEGQVRAPGESDRERRQADLQAMARSQDVAAAVALRELGYPVRIRRRGVLVDSVARDAPASGKVEIGDVIVSADGTPIETPEHLRRIIGRREPGDKVQLRLRRGSRTRTVTVKTIASPDEPTRAIIGVIPAQAADIKLPIDVEIDLGTVGGPSAGLAFALDVMEELGRDVDGGRRVAATGEIDLAGRVSRVGGLKQKTIGARQSGVDVFLVPAGENAREARRHAGGLRIIPVESFRQALRALATLPPKG